MSEFDDDDFLADFDVDAAVAASGRLASPPASSSAAASSGVGKHAAASSSGAGDNNPSPDSVAGGVGCIGSPSKRAKVNPYAPSSTSPAGNVNPYASSAPSFSPQVKKEAVASADSSSAKAKKERASPFGENSRFAVGNKVDHSDYPTFDSASSNSNAGTADPSAAATRSRAAQSAGDSPHQHQQKQQQTQEENAKQLEESLTSTLRTHFGHSKYRPGQLEALTALLGCGGDGSRQQLLPSSSQPPRDVAVFWSTGSGKSMVYQIPPLHTGKVGVVVSPLISLMEDQVAKLNGLLRGGGNNGSNGELAVFLGSGQTDPTAEQRALNGEYRLIYLTPEKLLAGNGYFLDALGRLHNNNGGNNICLLAIDESHCVSEWGHDFRPEYRQLGTSIRSHPTLGSVPILALTATAVPRVQRDIVTSLRMRNAKVVKQSFDRENLIIQVRRKPSEGSYRTALKPLVDELTKSSKSSSSKGGGGAAASGQGQSTIIYCPTRSDVDEITQYLSHQFATSHSPVRVEPYHAGMSAQSRTQSHTNFLVGRTAVIVATVAFGMGIDKPDTRRIIHWGPPKTVEEYYQQIGRAGRDGLPATAVMFANDGDFARYKSTFYLGNLSPEARAATERSIDSLRDFAMDGERCRRSALLRFFEEVPKFGERCGTCDVCRDAIAHRGDTERDFAEDGARMVLRAVDVLNGEQGLGTVEKVLKGEVVEGYRYRRGVNGKSVGAEMVEARERMTKRRPVKFFRELLPALIGRGYVAQGTKSAQVSGSGYTNSWTTYNITAKGQQTLRSGTGVPIVLPVPASVREIERIEEERRQKTLSQLQDAGFDMDQIPRSEIEQGDGEVIRALKQWHSYIDGLRRREMLDRIDQLDDLRGRVEAWRSDMAQRYRMAPGAVMEEHMVVKIAYATASLTGGSKIDRDTLLAVGLRSGGLDELVTALGEWVDETKRSGDGTTTSSAAAAAAPMSFPTDEPFAPQGPWQYAVYKPNKKTGLATWESSYNRFVAGEHPHAIAMSPANGKPIQVATVCGHILDGMAQGRPLPLRRLAAVSTPPNREEWEVLCQCEDVTGFDVTKDPGTSGVEGGTFKMTDFLLPIMGNAFAAKQYNERTEEEKVKFSHWCGMLKWYMALRRANYVPSFTDDEKTVHL